MSQPIRTHGQWRLPARSPGNWSTMQHWPWLDRQVERHPWLGLLLSVLLVLVCMGILVGSPTARSPRSGLPMWVFAVLGVGLFGFCAVRFAQRMRAGKRDD